MHSTPLILLSDGTTLEIQQVVRTVPGKRTVCSGTWKNQAIFAKLFIGHGASKYAKRDADGVNALQAANMLTPKLLAQMTAQDGKTAVLIFEARLPSENCEALWQKSTPIERFNLAKKLCQTLAALHQKNLLQTDLYFKNFLYFQEDIFTLDGDGIRAFAHLSKTKALENFAILISKMDVLEVEAWGASLLESYCAVNSAHTFSLSELKQLSAFYRTKAANKYAKKVLRACTDVDIKKTGGSLVALARPYAAALQTISINTLDDAMPHAKTLKNGTTCTVASADFSGKPCVIKRYNIKHIGHFLWRMFRTTRAEHSWINAHRLTLLGIPTAMPVALLEQHIGFLKGKAYFLTEFVDAPDIKQFFKQSTDKAARAAVVKNTVQLFYRLFLLKISHGDTKANNIKMADLQPTLIDLDSMRQHQADFFATRAHVRDLKRFMQNWKDDVSLYNAFLKTFKVVYKDHAVLKKARLLIED